MIILVIKKSDTDCPIAQQIVQGYPDAVVSNYKQYPDKELLGVGPALIVLTHPLAVLHTKTLRAAAAGQNPNLRILVVLPDDLAAQATNARIAGANSCLVAPYPTELLLRAVYDECTVFRRLVDTAELLKANPAIANRYLFISILGAGQHSVAVLAKDQQNNQVVTVKMLRKSISTTADFMTEFMTSAEKLKRITTPNFARVIDAGSWKGFGYLVSAVGQAENLFAVLDKRPLPESDVIKIALAITRALIAIKKCGIIHFDIKPENILINPRTNEVILSEFGLLTPFDAPDSAGFAFWPDPAFTSPEVFAKASWLTARSDIYSLGLLLYTCITRNNPFLGRPCDHDVTRRINDNLIRFDANDLSKCSPALAVTIEGMTDIDPDVRPRLREIETIFYQAGAIIGQPATTPPTPGTSVEAIGAKPPNAGFADGLDAAPLRHSRHGPSAASTGRIAPIRTPADAPAAPFGKTINWHDRKTQLRATLAALAALLIISLAFRGGYRHAKKRLIPTQFQQGPLQVFTCLDGHTEQIRTMDLRNATCPTCHEHTTPSYTCRKCKAVFGLHAWPRRDMTDKECAAFEQNQMLCPFCENTTIAPTPLSK